MSGHFFAGLSV